MINKLLLNFRLLFVELWWWIRTPFRTKTFFLCTEGVNIPRGRAINNWRKREDPKTYQDGSFLNIVELKQYHKELFLKWRYVNDNVLFNKKEHWDTYQETLKNMQGDCDGRALHLLGKARSMGFSDAKIGVTIVKGHMFFSLHHTKDDFYVFDNGFLSRAVVLASDLFPLKKKGVKLVPLYGFNYISEWTYAT